MVFIYQQRHREKLLEQLTLLRKQQDADDQEKGTRLAPAALSTLRGFAMRMSEGSADRYALALKKNVVLTCILHLCIRCNYRIS